MTVRAIFRYENNDSTLDLNLRFKAFLKRGVLEGAVLAPVASALQISVTPYLASSNDGMVITEDSTTTLDLVAGQNNIIALKAKYVFAAEPILEYVVYESSIFNGLIDKDDHIVFGSVILDGLATEATTDDISLQSRDVVDKQGRDVIRGKLGTAGVPASINTLVTIPDDGSIFESDSLVKIYNNSVLNSVAYNADAGFVEYNDSNGPVDLSGVSVGDRFKDGNGNFFTIIRVETSTLRIYIVDPNTSELPLTQNREGDIYTVTEGTGGIVSLYAWNGEYWLNITNTLSLQNELTAHRNNVYPDEYHATEDQEAAMLGSNGAPGFFNKYVTESDPRLPTQDENNALAGFPSSPSATNKYITENFSVVELAQFSAALPPFTLSLQSLGPYYVGTGAIGSANTLFALTDFEKNRGYINSDGIAPKITGIFKDAALTMALNPVVDADSQGFFSGADLYFQVDGIVDIGLRILYGKKQTLTTYDRGTDIRISPADDYVPSQTVMHIQDIKGRPFDDILPLDESNINLRRSIDGLISYLGSTQKTSIVAAKEDFEFLSKDTNFGPNYTFLNNTLSAYSYNNINGRVEYADATVDITGVSLGDRFTDGNKRTYTIVTINANSSPKYVEIVDTRTAIIPTSINTTVITPSSGAIFDPDSPIFTENEGIPKQFTFENTLLSSITYANGLVTYLDGSVDLSSVVAGNTFVDGLDNEYRVTAVNNIAKTLNIVNPLSFKPPAGISTSVGLPDDASVYKTTNPRGVLLNELKIQGSEIIPIDDLIRIENEYSAPEGFICFGIPSEKRVEPRVRLYGGWRRVQDDDTGEIVIQNTNSQGSLEFTGIITNISLLCRIQPGSPDLEVIVDEETGSPYVVSTSFSGDANATTAAIAGERFHRVEIASGLDGSNPSHVSIGFDTAGSTPLIIAGLEVEWIDTPNTLNWEPGIGFENTVLFRKDVISTLNHTGLGANSRGGSTTYGGKIGGSLLAVANSVLPDIDTGVTGVCTGITVNVTTNISKLVSFAAGDIIRLIGATAVEFARINTIVGSTINLEAGKTVQGVTIEHVCSSGSQSPNDNLERELARYFILNDFISGATFDFGPANVATKARRYVAHPDGRTVVAARNTKMVLTDGVIEVTGGTGQVHFSVLATRLDLVFNSATSFTLDITLDGSDSWSINVPSGPVRRTLYFNSKYQQHEVTVSSASLWTFEQLVIFGPAAGDIQPSAPLAQADFLASFTQGSSLYTPSPYRYSNGVAFNDASKSMAFGDGSGANPKWNIEQINAHFGQAYTTENDGDFTEGWFTGSGMELLYIERPDGGKGILEIDGVEVGAIGGANVYGAYSAGYVDTYAVSENARVVGVNNLSWGRHKFTFKHDDPREKNVGSSGYKLTVVGFYETNSNAAGTLSSTFVGKNNDRAGRYSPIGDIRDYSTFVQDLLGESAFPIQLVEKVDSAFGYTDSTGTPYNLGISEVSGKTRATLGFTFIPGTSPATPFGELQVELNGQVIPRYLAGVTQGAYYKELNGNEIELDSDYSTYNSSLFIRRVAGPTDVDTSLLGTISRQINFSAVVGTPTDLAANVATHTDLQSAINDVNAGEKIKVLPGTFAGAVNVNKRVYIEGSGYDTNINGAVTFSTSFCYVKEFRFGDSLTLDGASKGNIVAYCWQDPAETFSDTGVANSVSLVKVS